MLTYEKTYWKQGYEYLAGLDEAGRGCLAGPVVAASVIFPKNHLITGLTDSKQLSATKREQLYLQISEEALAIGVGICTPNEIDSINILQASLEAMWRATQNLKIVPNFLLIDGNKQLPQQQIQQVAIVKGDAKSHAIAGASIVAKVTRDRIMTELHDTFPQYDWHKNKGYPTKKHYEALAQYGITQHHRRSFNLVGKNSQLALFR